MVLEKVASSLLSFFLAKYIDKVNTNALKMSLFSGTASLDNLSVKKTALMQHQLPIKIVRGTVNKIFVSIPYIHFKSKPTQAGINDILILGQLNEKTLCETEKLSRSEYQIPEEFNSIDSALKEQKVSKFDFTTGLVGAIIENLQIKIQNIHIRLEFDIQDRTVAIGLIVPLIEIITIDENGNEIDANNSKKKIRKKLVLSNVSIYVDTKTEYFKQKCKKENIEFEQLMLNSMNDESHQYILHNFTFETVYEHSKPGQETTTIGNILNVTTSAIRLAIDSFQYQCFTLILAQQNRYRIKKFYSSCGKPDSYPEKENDHTICILWWRYAERCSEKKTRPFNFNPATALVFLRNRNQNLDKLSNILINPDPKNDEKYLRKLQEQYGGDVFRMFRAYAKYTTEKHLREKKHKEKLELQKKHQKDIDQESKEIQQLLSQSNNIRNNADTWSVQFNIKAIDIGLLLTPVQYIAMLQWKSWKGAFVMNKDDITLTALIGDMNIVNMKSREHTKIIELNKGQNAIGGTVSLNIAGNLSSHIFNIQSLITTPHLYADLSIIHEIRAFLSGAPAIHSDESIPKVQKRDHTHAEILNLLDTHSKLFVNVHLDSPIIVLPYKMPIEIMLGNLDIKSIAPDRDRTYLDKTSWYDEYSLELVGFQILFGKTVVCEPVTFSISYFQSFVRKSSIVSTIVKTKISSMDIGINQKQYHNLLELPDYLSQFVDNNDKPPNAKIEDNHNATHKPKNTIDTVDSIVGDLSLQFNMDFEEFGLRLLNSKGKIGSELQISGISTSLEALQKIAKGNFLLQYIKILGSKSKCICNFGNEEQPAIDIGASSQGIEISLSMHTSKPIIYVDFDWLKSLLDFVMVQKPRRKSSHILDNNRPNKPMKRKSTVEKIATVISGTPKHVNEYQLIRKLKIHPIYKIDVSFAGPTIHLPCGSNTITVNLGMLHLFTSDPIPRDPSNIESFYDIISCEFKVFEIYFNNDYLLQPFSLNIEARSAFILRHDVETTKLFIDIKDLDIQLKRSQFVSLLTIIDSVKGVIPSEQAIEHHDDSDEAEQTQKQTEPKKSDEFKLPLSMYVNINFNSLNAALLNEDNSIHTVMSMCKFESSFNSFQKKVDANLKIVVLKGQYNSQTLLHFGRNDTPSFNLSVHRDSNVTNMDLNISKPTILIDFFWIAQIKTFFAIHKHKTVQLNNDEIGQIEENALRSNTPSARAISVHNDSKSATSPKILDQRKRLDQEHHAIDSSKDSRQVEVCSKNGILSQPEKNYPNAESHHDKESQASVIHHDKEFQDTQCLDEDQGIHKLIQPENSHQGKSSNQEKNHKKEELPKDKTDNHEESYQLYTKSKTKQDPNSVSQSYTDEKLLINSNNIPQKANSNSTANLSLTTTESFKTQGQHSSNPNPVYENSTLFSKTNEYSQKLNAIHPKHHDDGPFNKSSMVTLFVITIVILFMRKYLPNWTLLLLLFCAALGGFYYYTQQNQADNKEHSHINKHVNPKKVTELSKIRSLMVSSESSDDETNKTEEELPTEISNDGQKREIDLLEMQALMNANASADMSSTQDISEKHLTLLKQLEDIQGTFVIDEPSITFIFVKKTQDQIRINAKINELCLVKNQNDGGSFAMNKFILSADDRDLMSPFSVNIDFNITESISAKIDLHCLILMLQTMDYQLLLEIGEYIPAVLHNNTKSIIMEKSTMQQTTNESLSIDTTEETNQLVSYGDRSILQEQYEEEEQNESKLPVNLDINFQKIGIDLFKQNKKLFNFDINGIVATTTAEGKFDLTVSSIICQEHMTSKCNDIISFSAPTKVHMNEIRDIAISISEDATVYMKMEAINALLSIFMPGEQILEYEKLQKIKHKHSHKKNKHKKKQSTVNKQSQPMKISIDSKQFKVIFFDDSEIATLLITGIAYEKIGRNQTIKIYDVALSDPNSSVLCPSNVLTSEKGNALKLELKKRETKIRLNRLIIFANLNVIRRVINAVIKNPPQLSRAKASEKEEEDYSELDSEKHETQNDTKQRKELLQTEIHDIEVFSKNNDPLSTEKSMKSLKLKEADDDSETESTTTTQIIKKDDSLMIEAYSHQISNGKKEKKFKLRFKYIQLTIPVNFEKSNEMLDIIIDGDFANSTNMKLSVHHITSKFIQYKGLDHPPFIPSISFKLNKVGNAMDLAINPTLISIAIDDIAEASLMGKSLAKFVSTLNFPHDDGIVHKNKAKSINQRIETFSLSVEMSKIKIVLNSDRYQTVPLFRFMIKQFIVMYTNLKPSNIVCVFDSIDFMDIHYLAWKILLDTFSIKIALEMDEDSINADTSVEVPININVAYQAIQMILTHIKMISKSISSKTLLDSRPPTYEVVNKSSKPVLIRKINSNDDYIVINPQLQKTLEFTREDKLEIKIGNDSRTIVTNKLQYPIFIDFQAISQQLDETGTTLLISSILLFENQTKHHLFLMKQKALLANEGILELPPGRQIPYTNLQNLKNMNFVLTTEKDSSKAAHSTFAIKDVKRRSVLLSCLFPNKRKLKLVIVSKFDSLTCSMIVKIQPNCIIRNQLPVDLFVRSSEENEILHLKPGEVEKTTIIDTSGMDFSAYFATSSFGDTVNPKNVIIDQLQEKVNIKTFDGFISSVHLNTIGSDPTKKKVKICFAVEAKKNPNKPQFELVCFAPTIIFNRSGLHLDCYNKLNEKKIIHESFNPREKGCNPNEDGCLLWSSDEYFKQKDTSRKLSLQLLTTEKDEQIYCYGNNSSAIDPHTKYMGDDVIACLATHINGPLLLPTRNPDIFIPLHYMVTSAQPYSSSTLVTITSQCKICNKTDAPFYLQPVILPKEVPSKGKIDKIHKQHKSLVPHSKAVDLEQQSNEAQSEISIRDDKKHGSKKQKKITKISKTEVSDETETDEETSQSKGKKKHFSLRLHKIHKSKSKTDNEKFESTENESQHHSHKFHLKIHKKKKNDKETSASTESTSTVADNDEEETTVTQDRPTIDTDAYEKAFKFGDVIQINNNDQPQQVRLAANGLLYAFKTDSKSKDYTLINFSEPIHTTFAHNGQLFEIENQPLGVEFLIVIKRAIFPQPIYLLNDLRIGSHKVYVTQKSGDNKKPSYKNKALPQTMTIVAYDVPFGSTDLTLHYKKHKIPINLIHVNTPKKKHHIFYEVVVNKNNTKTIVVSKVPYEHEKKKNVKIGLHIPVISISLIDKLNHEFALLTLQRIEFGVEFGSLNKIMFNLGSFQLDDLHPSAMLKVVIAAYPDVAEDEDIKSKNLLEFSASMFADTPLFVACKDLSFKCDPIILFADLSFVSDTIALLQNMFIIQNPDNNGLLFTPKPVEPSSLSSIPMTAESLTIDPIKFTIFVRAHSARPNLYKPVSYLLQAVPDITNGEIVLPSFHFEDCTMNAAYIQKEIVRPLIDAGIKQGLKLLFNTDIFMRSTGTKSASFAKKGEKLMNGQLQVLVQVPGSMILQGGETGLNVASKFLHNISFSNGASVNRVNATAKETMNSGVKALGHGFADAFTGLVKDPMKGKEKNGVGGVFIGIGKGLLGLVTKPVAGVLDAGVASISAMRKAMNGEDADVIPPIRIAHALPMKELANFTDEMMVSKDVAQFSFQMSDISELYNQYVERYVYDEETCQWFGVTQEFFFIADKNGNLITKSRIRAITSVIWDKESHIIRMEFFNISNKSCEIHVNDKERAVKITEMINSRRIALGIGE